VRCELALIHCGNRINEVTTATLDTLPLDQLPKSKPVTPYAVSLIVLGTAATANSLTGRERRTRGTEKPLRALAVAEDAPAGAGPAGSGPVPMARASPETRSGSHHDCWAATPQATDQRH
jgi:hypothetical protein